MTEIFKKIESKENSQAFESNSNQNINNKTNWKPSEDKYFEVSSSNELDHHTDAASRQIPNLMLMTAVEKPPPTKSNLYYRKFRSDACLE